MVQMVQMVQRIRNFLRGRLSSKKSWTRGFRNKKVCCFAGPTGPNWTQPKYAQYPSPFTRMCLFCRRCVGGETNQIQFSHCEKFSAGNGFYLGNGYLGQMLWLEHLRRTPMEWFSYKNWKPVVYPALVNVSARGEETNDAHQVWRERHKTPDGCSAPCRHKCVIWF